MKVAIELALDVRAAYLPVTVTALGTNPPAIALLPRVTTLGNTLAGPHEKPYPSSSQSLTPPMMPAEFEMIVALGPKSESLSSLALPPPM